MTANLDQALTWEPQGTPYSRPIPLADYGGQTIRVDVADGQVAIVLRDGEVRCVLLPQGHTVEVDDDPTTPGLTAKERELNLALEQLHDNLLGVSAARHLDQDDTVVFVAVDLMPELSLGGGGRARIRMDDPIRFYRSFLRRTEDLPPGDLAAVTRALVEDAILDVSEGSVDVRAEVATRLRTIGLDLIGLSVPAVQTVS